MTEEQLIAGCRRREREAQRELYARTSERIYRLLLRLTRDPQTAADLLQETYIRAFEHLDGFQGSSSLNTWVYRIAVNEAGQHFRRRGRYERMLRADFPRPAEAEAGGQAAAAARLDVHAALARLPDEERTLIMLKYFEGLDYARMAEVLGKPPGTIASGLNRARGKPRRRRHRAASNGRQEQVTYGLFDGPRQTRRVSGRRAGGSRGSGRR